MSLNFVLIKCAQFSVEVQLKLINEDYAQQLLGILERLYPRTGFLFI